MTKRLTVSLLCCICACLLMLPAFADEVAWSSGNGQYDGFKNIYAEYDWASGTGTFEVVNGPSKVYAEAKASSKLLGKMASGTEGRILDIILGEDDYSWCHVQTDELDGWMRADAGCSLYMNRPFVAAETAAPEPTTAPLAQPIGSYDIDVDALSDDEAVDKLWSLYTDMFDIALRGIDLTQVTDTTEYDKLMRLAWNEDHAIDPYYPHDEATTDYYLSAAAVLLGQCDYALPTEDSFMKLWTRVRDYLQSRYELQRPRLTLYYIEHLTGDQLALMSDDDCLTVYLSMVCRMRAAYYDAHPEACVNILADPVDGLYADYIAFCDEQGTPEADRLSPDIYQAFVSKAEAMSPVVSFGGLIAFVKQQFITESWCYAHKLDWNDVQTQAEALARQK